MLDNSVAFLKLIKSILKQCASIKIPLSTHSKTIQNTSAFCLFFALLYEKLDQTNLSIVILDLEELSCFVPAQPEIGSYPLRAGENAIYNHKNINGVGLIWS